MAENSCTPQSRAGQEEQGSKPGRAKQVLEMMHAYQPACVLAAAVDHDLFNHLAQLKGRSTAAKISKQLGVDLRGITILLDALVAINLLSKEGEFYVLEPDVAEVLTDGGSRSVLPMVQHQANCLRRWSRLPWVVKTGQLQREPSIRGEAADTAAFIGAMHVISKPNADVVVSRLGPFSFKHLLDVGGASGTWTVAFLKANPATTATATIFDLSEVIPMARDRMAAAGLADRVRLVSGNFYVDALPSGGIDGDIDYVWLSAIAHQNSREQNRQLFGKIRDALSPGGTLAIRDIVMDEDHVYPPGGAMFAVNMLAGTDGGGTYSFNDYREDLEAAGFVDVQLVYRDEWMDSLIRATRQ